RILSRSPRPRCWHIACTSRWGQCPDGPARRIGPIHVDAVCRTPRAPTISAHAETRRKGGRSMRVLIARVLLLASLLAAIPLLQAEKAPALERSLVAQPSVARLGDVGSRGNRQRGERVHKPFRHPGGDEDLVRGKNQPSFFAPSERETARPGPLVTPPPPGGFD